MAEKIRPGSGFILFNEKDEVLTLLVDETLTRKNAGCLDFPKGVIEKGESPWDCAVRECEEEAGIIISTANLEWGINPIINGNLTIFLARTKSRGSLNRNPNTGIYEHLMLMWDRPTTIMSSLFPYLKPIMQQAMLKTGIS